MWINAKHRQPPKRHPVFLRKDACVSVGVWSESYAGWVAQADGFDARDHLGETIVVDDPDYWFLVPDLDPEAREMMPARHTALSFHTTTTPHD